MNDELKPCPFCGGKARLLRGMFDEYAVGCGNDNCEFCGENSQDTQKAISQWNTRPIEDAMRAELDASKAEIERLRAQLESARAWIPQWAQDDPAEDAVWKKLEGDDE